MRKIVAFMLVIMTSMSLMANDYLEKKKHYMVYASGADRIHFKVPSMVVVTGSRYASRQPQDTDYPEAWRVRSSL